MFFLLAQCAFIHINMRRSNCKSHFGTYAGLFGLSFPGTKWSI